MASISEDLNFIKSDYILHKIEEICLNIIHTIHQGKTPYFSFPRRTNWGDIQFTGIVGMKASSTGKHLFTISADRVQSIKKFGTMLKVLKIIYSLVQENKYITKRDIFYQHPDVYQNQRFVDRIIDDIACMLEIPRWELHILATCKGLVAGMIQMEDSKGTHVDCQYSSKGVQIPAHSKDMQNICTNAKFVLVVEKDATFQKLLDCNFCQKMKPCILMTGKGFPDNGTRLLLKELSKDHKLPIFVLVDADPHGIEIMAVYKFGSKSQAFENKHLAVPSMEWIGIWPEDIKRLNIKEASLIHMNDKDVNKAVALKKRPYFVNDPTFLSQIDLMLDMGLKAEIQCLDAINSNYLCDVYLPWKINLLLPEINVSSS